MDRRLPQGLQALCCRTAFFAVVCTGLANADESVLPENFIPETAVVGGSDASFGQFESIVALVDASVQGQSSALVRQFCGGTIIGSRWVMTAAHCVHTQAGAVIDASGIRIVEGSLDLQGDDVEERVVTTIFVHPGYDHGSIDTRDDIALLEIANELDSTPVELSSRDPESLDGVFATVAGWGATEFQNNIPFAFASNLQQASVPIVTRAACNVPESYNGLIQPGQMCAGFINGGVDACVGDSGGPLYIGEGSDQVQVGITSFGAGCAVPNFYGVYTSVSDYIEWIDGLTGGIAVNIEDPETDNPESETPDSADAEDEQNFNVFGNSSSGAFGPIAVLAAIAFAGMRRRRASAGTSATRTRS